MTEVLFYFLFIFLGIVIGFFFNKLKSKSETESIITENKILYQNNERLDEQVVKLQSDKEILISEKAQYQRDVDNLQIKIQESKKELDNIQEKFTKEFENLATKILDENSTKFKTQNKESINAILNPLKEKIESFEKKITDAQVNSVDMHSSLKEQLRQLKDLNQQMSKETLNLTKALKGDSKTQGDWGETQLEILLEKANLTKGIHFSTQGGFRDDEGRIKKPDFIINLPENRHLIIDSKVSLTAYESYCSADNDQQKEQHLKRHIDSIRKHFKDLSEKKYDALYEINSPDYVLMFVPIEPALMLALSQVNNLYLEALDKNVVLVSTSTLLATLSTISSMWRQENQKRNALEIARQAGALYEKFNGFLLDLVDVGVKLDVAKSGYEEAMKKLSSGKGNLIVRVEKLKTLGAKTTKSIDQKLLDRASEQD